MIVVRAYLVPYGVEPEELIGEVQIWNDGTGDRETGHYGVKAATLPPEQANRARLVEPVEEVFGSVVNFPRQDRHVWHLVTEALGKLKWSEK